MAEIWMYGEKTAKALAPYIGLKCSACGGTEHLRPYSPWHHIPICNPCFMVWYDYGETDPKKVGEISLAAKAQGKSPWTREYAPREMSETGE